MGRYLEDIIDRSARRAPWRVEVSAAGADRFLVRSPEHGVIADDLPLDRAEHLSASFNAALADAAVLASAWAAD